MKTLHTATVLASALLLFLLEPMVARALLPLYGGSPAVWNSCLLFFQGLLLAGYAYAHYGGRWLGNRGHLVAHAALLLAPLALLPLRSPSESPPASAWPVPSLLAALAGSVGLPFFVLSTNSSMVQKWHALRSGESPYFLYAASNVGSFVALLAYPFVVEPALGSREQLRLWSLGYLGFVALAGVALAGAWRANKNANVSVTLSAPLARRLRWLVRAAVPSSLLLAVSLTITTDVAAIPLLWVLPLGLYLASFVIAFWPRLPYPRRALCTLAALLISAILLRPSLGHGMLPLALGLPLAVLFVGCWICHADLARDRPEPEQVTEYYLWIAAGGFAGGVFGNLIAPLLFNSVAEYPLSLAAVAILLGLGARRRLLWRLFAVACVCAALFAVFVGPPGVRTLEARRSFFGVARVREADGRRRLVHGTTAHGVQKIGDPTPLMYYAPLSPLSRAVGIQHEGARIAVIGLGTGSLAYNVKPGQTIRFYEIDPIIEPLARRWFSFLADCRGTVEVRLGDARLTLRDEPDAALDLLMVDAFSSDAIPVHLITVEAIQLYFAKLKPGGLLVLHVSNRYLDLVRVLRGIAHHLGIPAAGIHYVPDPEESSSIQVVALARSRASLQPLFDRGWDELAAGPEVVWTDDRSNLLSVIDW